MHLMEIFPLSLRINCGYYILVELKEICCWDLGGCLFIVILIISSPEPKHHVTHRGR